MPITAGHGSPIGSQPDPVRCHSVMRACVDVQSSTTAVTTADITRANATFTVTPYNVPYDGQPHTATVGTITGVNGETGATVGTIHLTGTTHTKSRD